MPEASLIIAERLAALDGYSGEDLPIEYVNDAEGILDALVGAGFEVVWPLHRAMFAGASGVEELTEQ